MTAAGLLVVIASGFGIAALIVSLLGALDVYGLGSELDNFMFRRVWAPLFALFIGLLLVALVVLGVMGR